MKISFTKPYISGKEKAYIEKAIQNGHLSGNGEFTKKCQFWLEEKIGSPKALLTHSCTAALEMAAILANIQPGDEIIMPSYTFVSTANAFVLRGGIPVFVDIRRDTLNLDETKIESAITKKTKAIVPVHYAGVACEMDTIMDLAREYNLLVIEDAAQGILSSYKGRPLGSIGHMAALSFHETKNVISGEGGALLINDSSLINRAEIIWEKGTNRTEFFRGEVDKYTWVDIGSSFLPSEIIAAFLWAQLEEADHILQERKKVWQEYHTEFAILELMNKLRRPIVPKDCEHNAHMYYLLLTDHDHQSRILKILNEQGIGAVFHYVPLHNSPAGKKYGRTHEELLNSEELSNRILRLPLWVGLRQDIIYKVFKEIFNNDSMTKASISAN